MEAPCLLSQQQFYGKSRVNWKARLGRREKEFQKHSVPVEYRPIIDGPPSDWKTFYRQDEAFSYTRQKAESLHVFAFESSKFVEKHGQRLYLVASYPQFWHYYRQLAIEKRHHYEVIPIGSVCRLYFDLEFSTAQNPGADGVQMTNAFIKFVCGWLLECFNISCSSQDALQLDASTSEKFSRHLIFHLPNAVFHDNIQAGYFVQHCASCIWEIYNHDNSTPVNINNKENEEEPSPPKRAKVDESHRVKQTHKTTVSTEDLKKWGLEREDIMKFVVKNKHGKDALFCDTAVYTKNRNFRLYLSCKMGKNNPLKVAKENQYKPDVAADKLGHRIFMDSLITNVEFDTDTRILSFEGDRSSGIQGVQGHISRSPEESLQGSQHSPYPELDDFIIENIQQGGVAGYIRRWSYFPSSELLLYDIGRNRWCHNVARQHRSNNIMLIADLKASVFYQKCHDPDCKGYKSPEFPIPSSVLPSHHLEEEEEKKEPCNNEENNGFEDISEEELLQAASAMEQSHLEEETQSIRPDNIDKGSDIIDKGSNGAMEEDIADEELLEALAFMEEQRTKEKNDNEQKKSDNSIMHAIVTNKGLVNSSVASAHVPQFADSDEDDKDLLEATHDAETSLALLDTDFE